MDLGALIKAPTEDPDWIKKCGLMGLFMLIPVAGAFNLSGWAKACYQARSAGQKTLPPAELSYIGDGFWLFVTMLPLFLPIFVIYIMMLVGMVALGDTALGPIIGIVCGLLLMVFALAATVLSPAIYYRHFVHGDRMAALKVGELIKIVKNHTSPYLMLWVTIFIAGLIGQLGVMACYIGMFFTLPFAMAIYGYAIADFANETNRA